MITPQNGIFAQGTHSHYFLELDLGPGIRAERALVSLRDLGSPEVSAGGVNFVIAFGPDLWRAIAPDEAPSDLGRFTAISGRGGKNAPAGQHDLWLWFSGSTPDVVFEHARTAWLAIRSVMTLATEQPCFVYRDSRDLTGFIDGTENPPPLDAPNVALIPTGLPGGGGSHVLVMRWVHNLEAFHGLPVDEQERIVGRRKSDSKPLKREERHPTGHLARVQIDVDGVEQKIYRRSVPYGTVNENGLYFVGFSSERKRFDLMLSSIFGTAEDGHHDRLIDFSRPVGGSFYFAPSLTTWRSCAIR